MNSREDEIRALCAIARCRGLTYELIASGLSLRRVREVLTMVTAYMDDDDLMAGMPLEVLDAPDALLHPTLSPELRDKIRERIREAVTEAGAGRNSDNE